MSAKRKRRALPSGDVRVTRSGQVPIHYTPEAFKARQDEVAEALRKRRKRGRP